MITEIRKKTTLISVYLLYTMTPKVSENQINLLYIAESLFPIYSPIHLEKPV